MAEAMAAAMRTPEARAEAAMTRACEYHLRFKSLLGAVYAPLLELIELDLLWQLSKGERPDPWRALCVIYRSHEMVNIRERVEARMREEQTQ